MGIGKLQGKLDEMVRVRVFHKEWTGIFPPPPPQQQQQQQQQMCSTQ